MTGAFSGQSYGAMGEGRAVRVRVAVSVILVVLMCVFVFLMSATPADDSDALSLGVAGRIVSLLVPGYDQLSAAEQAQWQMMLNHPVRKTAHFLEYALLGAHAANMFVQITRLKTLTDGGGAGPDLVDDRAEVTVSFGIKRTGGTRLSGVRSDLVEDRAEMTVAPGFERTEATRLPEVKRTGGTRLPEVKRTEGTRFPGVREPGIKRTEEAWMPAASEAMLSEVNGDVQADMSARVHPAEISVQSIRKCIVCGWAFATLYSVTDELHQLFVSGRTGMLTDVLLDSAGALVGALIFWALLAARRRRVTLSNSQHDAGAVQDA